MLTREMVDSCRIVLERRASRLTRNSDQAGDLVQSTWERAWRRRDQCRGQNPAAWMTTILRRLWLDHLRERRVQPLETVELERRAASEEPDWALSLSLRDAVRTLPQDLRRIVVLKYYCGYKQEEIAHALDLKLGLVKKRIHRSLTLLRQALKGDPECWN
ncbi:MAG: RNA polymerase sigma factor [Candidatus Eremiobacterota bacterium]